MGYNVFISYRREGASELAQLLYSRLCADGYAPFFDVESMRSGKFNKQLYDRIEECEDMLLLLPPKALDPRDAEEDWVILEIEHALKHQKNIVPVFMRNFEWPRQLPEQIEELRHCHGVTADMEYFDAVYARIKSCSKHSPKSRIRRIRIRMHGCVLWKSCWKMASLPRLRNSFIRYWRKRLNARLRIWGS